MEQRLAPVVCAPEDFDKVLGAIAELAARPNTPAITMHVNVSICVGALPASEEAQPAPNGLFGPKRLAEKAAPSAPDDDAAPKDIKWFPAAEGDMARGLSAEAIIEACEEGEDDGDTGTT